ncbi:MAG: hypothetical protein AB1780_08690 [Pseudomonadota bacterium]
MLIPSFWLLLAYISPVLSIVPVMLAWQLLAPLAIRLTGEH